MRALALYCACSWSTNPACRLIQPKRVFCFLLMKRLSPPVTRPHRGVFLCGEELV